MPLVNHLRSRVPPLRDPGGGGGRGSARSVRCRRCFPGRLHLDPLGHLAILRANVSSGVRGGSRQPPRPGCRPPGQAVVHGGVLSSSSGPLIRHRLSGRAPGLLRCYLRFPRRQQQQLRDSNQHTTMFPGAGVFFSDIDLQLQRDKLLCCHLLSNISHSSVR